MYQIARLPEITQLLYDPDEQVQEDATREFRKLLSIGETYERKWPRRSLNFFDTARNVSQSATRRFSKLSTLELCRDL